jgi:hypothetical protein
MSDVINGKAVLKRNEDGREFLHLMCIPTKTDSKGTQMHVRIPVAKSGDTTVPAHDKQPWWYSMPIAGRMELFPSLQVMRPTWDDAKQDFTGQMEEAFHTAYNWTVEVVPCPADRGAYEHLCELNPEPIVSSVV